MLSYDRRLDLASGFVELFDLENTLERKAPQAIRTVAPGVEIPAVAIAGQALGRDNPFADIIAPPAVVGNEQTTAPEQGRHDIYKQFGRHRPPGVTANMHTLGLRGRVKTARIKQLIDAPLHRLQLILKQAGLHIAKHVARNQQRLQLLRADPQAGQLEAAGQRPVVVKPASDRKSTRLNSSH